MRARAYLWLPSVVLLLLLGPTTCGTLGACSSEPGSSVVFVAAPTDARARPGPNEPRGSGAKPARASYARTCTTNADCVLVSFAEAACDTCKCPNDAISVDDQRRFFDEEGAFRATCTAPDQPCLADCAPLAARCLSGACTVVTTGAPPVRDAGADASARDAADALDARGD